MTALLYRGRHRAPAPRQLVVRPERIPALFLADLTRHVRDHGDVDRAMTWAGMDRADALTAWRAAS